jgi:hypothetical protein
MHSARIGVGADQKAAAFLWICTSRVVDYVLKLIGRDENCQFDD